MPNFHLHWLVAWNALDQVEGPAKLGRDAYLAAGRQFQKELHEALDGVKKPEDVGPFFASAVPDARANWEAALRKTPEIVEQVSCFAACMLGACGPDFWTCTSESGFGVLPDTASHHFDLGHYNRTHQQFRVSIAAIGKTAGAQFDLERSYFLGMAMHVAADLVLHQLVNVYAGAYTLLQEDVWNNEHDTVIKDLWKVHNKVEHYWDTYVRYRFLSDLTTVEPMFDGDIQWLEPLGFPVVDTLVAKARQKENTATRDALLARLLRNNPKRHLGKAEKRGGLEVQDDLRRAVELPLVFPARAADRILGEWAGQTALRPFIYNRVVHPTAGAYPSELLYDAGIAEKTSAQMSDSGYNERRKLRYFSSRKNAGDFNWACLNYLTYRISPDLGRLRDTNSATGLMFGRDAFYDLEALKAFGQRAIEAAGRFGTALASAYKSQDPNGLAHAGRFWHLDSGLGFEIQAVNSYTNYELVTRLDFVHVFDRRITGNPATGPDYDRTKGNGMKYLTGKGGLADDFTKVSDPAFPVRARETFKALDAVKEDDAKAYLDRIVVGSEARSWLKNLEVKPPAAKRESYLAKEERATQAWLDAFFAREESPASWSHPFSTVEEEGRRQLAISLVKHRLTLELRIPIASIGDETAMFLYCDDNNALRDSSTKAAHGWATNDKLIAFSKAPAEQGQLRVFTARLLLNFTEEKQRKIAAGEWNNVVPYDKSKKFYGRNFAIATGRPHVLHAIGDGNCFDPNVDFAQYSGSSPTEELFLTIFPLVRTRYGVFDAFSKQSVARGDFDLFGVRKISFVEWKKVVLFFELNKEAAQLDRCLIDGLHVPVVPVTE